MRIGIVGGSIAGCTAASALLRDGHDVQVFERELGEPGGAGIGLSVATFDTLVARELISRELPRFEIERYLFAGRDASETPFGRVAFDVIVPSFAVHWSDLYRALRARVPDDAYHRGREVRAVEQTECSARLSFADGTDADFELVVFADGYRSLGRRYVCPETPLEYRGYVLWRGLLEETALEVRAPLQRQVLRLSHGGAPGHSVAYAIPHEPVPLVNYASYLPLPAAELTSFLVDRDGRARSGSLPPGCMPLDVEARLRAQMCSVLPPYFARFVERLRDTFAQPVFDVAPTTHRRGRVLTLGDAGALAPPLTGSGVQKAVGNALGLASKLRSARDLDSALGAWDVKATADGAALVRLGRHMEDRLIWNAPDFATISEADARSFWQSVLNPPQA